MTNDNPSPARSPYVAIPRDLDTQPEFAGLSRDAQWLLQHLERDPYRLKCGVFVYNERLVARAAKATTDEVGAWWCELVEGNWITEDLETGEAWLTQHMRWDNTMSNSNHAKAVLRDVKRIRSARLSEQIERVVFAKHPTLNPAYGIDPEWQSGDTSNAIGDAIPDVTLNSRSTEHVHTEPEARDTGHDPRDPEPAPGARASACCEKCGGAGIIHGKGGESKLCSCQLKVVG